MNKNEFKQAMMAGLGRCYITLKKEKDINQYKDIILWGIKQELACNTQDDGTMENYMYNLINCYPDKTEFLRTLISEFLVTQDEWKLVHLLSLLILFIKDDNDLIKEEAKIALYQKYDKIFEDIMNTKDLDKLNSYEYIYSILAIAFINIDKNYIRKIAIDLGYIFYNTSFKKGDFNWLFEDLFYGDENILNLLKNQKFTLQETKFIKIFLSNYHDYADNETNLIESINNNNSSNNKDKLLEKRNQNVNKYISTEYIKNPNDIPFDELINLLNHENHEVRFVAEKIFEKRKGMDIVNYSLDILNKDFDNSLCFNALLNNYNKVDLNYLLSYLKNMKIDYDENTNWHNIIYYISISNKNNLKLPKEILLLSYNFSLCRNCRFRILKLLHKRGFLTKEIENECYYDGNLDIINYAKENKFNKIDL